MKKKIFITIYVIAILIIITSLYSFPGDHNSLTCTKRLFVIPTDKITDLEKLENYLQSDNPDEVKAARQYVKDNLEEIKEKIRKHHDFGTDITMWGDSLTDLVDLYGAVPFDNFGFVPLGDFGNETGAIDSWGDYFTIFGNSYGQPFKARNYATSEHETGNLLERVNTSVGYIDGIWDVLPDKDHCIHEQMVGKWSRQQYMFDPSSPRSVLMIGGNDVMKKIALFPFINKYQVEQALENITFIIDWNIENGKQIFLEGTFPANAESLAVPYNSVLVNRESICRPLEDSLIEPDEIPWYVCAFDAGLCASMVQSSLVHNANVTKAFSDFNHMIFAGPYFSKKDGVHSPDPAKILMTMTSINQACINDRLANSIALSYKTVYPDNVKFHLLYNHFNKTGADMSAQNFWVPIDGLFGKYPDYNEPPKDPIHIGPYGYRLWGTIIGNKLKSIGWNEKTSADEMPDPVIELEGGGPGRKIRKKAKEVNLFGKESTGLMPISPELAPYDGLKYGGFYRQYWNEDRIYIQQIKNATVDVPMKERYGEAYHLKGVLLEKYLEINGTLTLGFPMSDTLNVGPAGTFRRIFFECGYMTHNTLDSGNPGNYTINGREACPALKNNDPNYKPDFKNCLSEGECTGRWFEDYVFQLEPTVGNSPFRFEMTENNYGFPGKLDRVGRIRGGPTNNATGYWTIKVKMIDARGKESEEKKVHISTGW